MKSTKANTTKNSLIASAISLLLCVSLFVGTTFAWFTDSVTNKGNKIQAGNLDISLSELKEDGKYAPIVNEKPIFDSVTWEPGYSEFAVLKIANDGSLALKYQLDFSIRGEKEAVAGFKKLAEVIDVYAYLPQNTAITELPKTDDIGKDYQLVGTLSEIMNDGTNVANGRLQTGEADYAGIVLKMKEDAGNEYMGLGAGVTFDIVLRATQLSSEQDGFASSDYDKNAEYPEIPDVVVPSEDNPIKNGEALRNAIANAAEGDVIALAEGTYEMNMGDPIRIEKKGVKLIGAGKDKTIIDTKENSGAQAVLYVDASDVTVSDLNIKSNATGKNVSMIKVTQNSSERASNFTIKNVNVERENNLGHGIDINSVDGVLIDNVTLSGYGKCGIALTSATDVIIKNTTTVKAEGVWADIGCMDSKEAATTTVTIDGSNNFAMGLVYTESEKNTVIISDDWTREDRAEGGYIWKK